MTRKKKKPQVSEPVEEQVDVAPESEQPDSDDLLGRLQRVSADYVNYQKRARRDLDLARQFANEGLIKSLLPVLDDMERALAAGRDNHDADDPLLTGLQLVHDKALETLGRFGVKVIEAHGLEFDPDRHTALMQQLSPDHDPNIVLHVAQKGYELKGRTIRAAGVVVSKASEEPDEDQAEDQDGPDPSVTSQEDNGGQ